MYGSLLLQLSNPDGKLQGNASWTRNSCSTVSTDKSQPKQVGGSREDPKLAWKDQVGFNVAAVQDSLPPNCTSTAPFTADIKTPSSNLTAEVEWWRGSSRVPRCTHRILMAVRQRPQALGRLYKPRSIVLPIAPCWHAITQTVFTFNFCLVFLLFFPCLFCASTSLPPFHCSSRELLLPSV